MFTLRYEEWATSLGAVQVGSSIFQRGCGDYARVGISVPVYITEGKLAGQVLPVVEIKGARVKIKDNADKVHTISYASIERVDSNQQPIFDVIRDMTGRVLAVGDWVTFLGNDPRSNVPGLVIAKVRETNGKGELIVTPKMFDGEKTVSADKINYTTNISDADKTIANTRRSLRLPIEKNDLMMLFIKDFERFDDDT